MADFYVRQNDLREAIQATLKGADGVAVDLSSGVSSVRYNMRSKVTGAAKVDAAATIVTAASGIVKYQWVAGDTDTPGLYNAEFEVLFSSGASPLSFPNRGYLLVEITPELG